MTLQELANLGPRLTKKAPRPSTAMQLEDRNPNFEYDFTYATGDNSSAQKTSTALATSGDAQCDLDAAAASQDDTAPSDHDVALDDVLPYPVAIGDDSEAAPTRPVTPPPSPSFSRLNPTWLGVPLVPLLLFVGQKRQWLREPLKRFEAMFYGARRVVEVDDIDIHTCLPVDSLVRGIWSPDLVTQLLGRPDYVVLDPQRLRVPLRFYDRNRVAKVQAGKKFKQHLAKIEAENARTAAKIRRWVALCQLDTIAAANPIPAASAARTVVPAPYAPARVPVAAS